MKKHRIAIIYGVIAIIIAIGGGLVAISTGLYWNLIWAILLLISGGLALNVVFRGEKIIWQQLLKDVEITSNAQILDLDSAWPTPLLTIAKAIESPGRVTAISGRESEQSLKELKRTRQAVQEAAMADKVDLVSTTMLNLPFTDHCFDYVVASFAFQGIKPAITRGRALQEAARALAAQGTFLLVDVGNFSNLKAVLVNMGFKDIRIKNAGINGWWGGPWWTTKVLIARRR